MEKDMFGVSRLKVNLHMHTTLSDGSKTPEEAAEIYKKAGYDVVAITDHWIHRDSGEIGGLRILSGAEYNIGGGDASTGVYHILGIGCSKKPNLTQEAGPQKIIDEVHRCSGIAILAHPAWSLNTAQQAAALNGVDATEIFKLLSEGLHQKKKPFSRSDFFFLRVWNFGIQCDFKIIKRSELVWLGCTNVSYFFKNPFQQFVFCYWV